MDGHVDIKSQINFYDIINKNKTKSLRKEKIFVKKKEKIELKKLSLNNIS